MNWASKLAKPYRVSDGDKFRLKDFDPQDTGEFKSKEEAKGLLQKSVAHIEELQDKLYAQDRWCLLLIFQAMDAAGKDGAIKHVMSGINPKAARCIPSRRRRMKNSIMIIFGGRQRTCRSADG